MTASYAEDSENTEPSDDDGSGRQDPQEDFAGEYVPNPPPTATEEPDTKPRADQPQDPDQTPTSPGVG